MIDGQLSPWVAKYEQYVKLPKLLIEKCITSIQFNDRAHDLEHVYSVCRLGYLLGLREGMTEVECKMIQAGCLMHDLGCRYDRDSHHFISYGLAFEYLDNWAKGIFTPEQIMVIANSCYEHRASYKLPRRGKISELVALADRGEPDYPLYIKRAVQFRLGKDLTYKELKEQVIKHMFDKFSRGGGYVWTSYPKLGMDIFSEQWETFFAQLNDVKETEKLISEIYFDLTSEA